MRILNIISGVLLIIVILHLFVSTVVEMREKDKERRDK